MKRYFLGMAANYSGEDVARHLFSWGTQKDLDNLKTHLERRYKGEAYLCKNGRSALTLALKAYFNKGDAVIINGFTCYAVYEAVQAAGLKPIFADISKDNLNFTNDTLLDAISPVSRPFSLAPVVTGLASKSASVVTHAFETDDDRIQPKGIIIQNTLGNPVDIKQIEVFAKKHNLTIIEDLAHCAGVKYPDGREAGTVGAASILSFGKDKSIDTISGGALILRMPEVHKITAPTQAPKLSDHLRARFYPLFGSVCRALSYIHLGGALMRGLVKIHWVERSADNKLDTKRRLSKFEAKLALEQLQQLRRNGEAPIREFYLVDNREELLQELKKHGYYFDGFWYEKPISPQRYYKKTKFPEQDCPNAVYAAEHIVNLPVYYTRSELSPARKIIKKYAIQNMGDGNG